MVEKITHKPITTLNHSKPFLILLDNANLIPMTKNPGLKLFTKTWSSHKRETAKTKKDERPLTATLDKPTILDIRFIGKIDMSLVRKEFLNFSNLCRIPLMLKNQYSKKVSRPLSLPSTKTNTKMNNNNNKRNRKNDKCTEATDTSSWEDEDSSVSFNSKKRLLKNMKISNNNGAFSARTTKQKEKKKCLSDANNNKPSKLIRKSNNLPCPDLITTTTIASINNNNNVVGASIKLPEPCKTCGRPDLPERFHSHPTTPLSRSSAKSLGYKAADTRNRLMQSPVKNIVQKPNAIRYKSKSDTPKQPSPIKSKPPSAVSSTRHVAVPNNKLSPLPQHPVATKQPNSIPRNKSGNTQENMTNGIDSVKGRVKSAKRTLTCYICGREFGTASLNLHEPKCLEKWDWENRKLPSHLQRKPPIKPQGSSSQDEWNQLAWESSQANLVPCRNCARTFYPDRLVVHQKSCKTPQSHLKIPLNGIASPTQHNNNSMSTNPLPRPGHQVNVSSTPHHQPPSVKCYICGRLFGTHSIKIHERQCLKKWQAENDALPPDIRSPLPKRDDGEKSPEHEPQKSSSQTSTEREPRGSKKPPLFPCYLCGKLFSVSSIYIHEPQCLKLWKIENDKLPASKRRPIPMKPDVKFTRNGSVDYAASNEANWQSHLSQLVPCEFCQRTFNPDRVAVHERSCKGNI